MVEKLLIDTDQNTFNLISTKFNYIEKFDYSKHKKPNIIISADKRNYDDRFMNVFDTEQPDYILYDTNYLNKLSQLIRHKIMNGSILALGIDLKLSYLDLLCDVNIQRLQQRIQSENMRIISEQLGQTNSSIENIIDYVSTHTIPTLSDVELFGNVIFNEYQIDYIAEDITDRDICIFRGLHINITDDEKNLILESTHINHNDVFEVLVNDMMAFVSTFFEIRYYIDNKQIFIIDIDFHFKPEFVTKEMIEHPLFEKYIDSHKIKLWMDKL